MAWFMKSIIYVHDKKCIPKKYITTKTKHGRIYNTCKLVTKGDNYDKQMLHIQHLCDIIT